MFYVYEHYKADTNEIFYVGKGKGDRAYSKNRYYNKHWMRVVNKHGIVVKIIAIFERECDAFTFEVQLISLHGRKNIGTGPLINKTPGGTGGDTMTGKKHTKKTRKKMSVGAKNRPPASKETRLKLSKANAGTKNCMYGKTHKQTTKNKIAKKRLGFKESIDQCLKHSIDMTKEKNPRFDAIIYVWYHPEYGYEKSTRYDLVRKYPEQKLNTGSLGMIVFGKMKQSRGWEYRGIDNG